MTQNIYDDAAKAALAGEIVRPMLFLMSARLASGNGAA